MFVWLSDFIHVTILKPSSVAKRTPLFLLFDTTWIIKFKTHARISRCSTASHGVQRRPTSSNGVQRRPMVSNGVGATHDVEVVRKSLLGGLHSGAPHRHACAGRPPVHKPEIGRRLPVLCDAPPSVGLARGPRRWVSMEVPNVPFSPLFPAFSVLRFGAFLGFFDPDPGVVFDGYFSADVFLLFLLLSTVCHSIIAACPPLVAEVIKAPV